MNENDWWFVAILGAVLVCVFFLFGCSAEEPEECNSREVTLQLNVNESAVCSATDADADGVVRICCAMFSAECIDTVCYEKCMEVSSESTCE